MRHDWIFDVLADLRAYADLNDLPALAAQVEKTIRVADLEVTDAAGSMERRLDAAAQEAGVRRQRRAH